MNWKLSAFADEAGSSCEEQIAGLVEAGISLIDIRGMDGYNITTMPVEHARQVKEKLDGAGIKLGMMGSPIGKIDIEADVEEDLQRLRHLALLAPILDCNAVRIFSYYNAQGRPHDEFQRESLMRLSQLRDLARESGMMLFHENERHIFGDLCADVLTIAELRDPTCFGLIFDFDNYTQSGENAWENWTQLKHVTDAFHLKDSLTKEHVPVGQGEGCVERILKDAAAMGWNGLLSVEPHLQHSGEVALTGPSGIANQQYSALTANQSFQIACKAARDMLQLCHPSGQPAPEGR